MEINQNTRPTLLALATATRLVAQSNMNLNIVFQWASTLLSCFAVYYNELFAWVLVTIGFSCKVTSFLINIHSQKYHSISREAQRLALLEDSYGKIIDSFQLVELRQKINQSIDDMAKNIPYAQPYYSSNSKKGNLRLKENIQQSTFWSKNLLGIYGDTIFRRFSISLVLAVVITILLFMIRIQNDATPINPYLLTVGTLTFILGLIDYFNIWLSCKSSVELLSEVDRRLEKIEIDKVDILLANFADYGIASVIAPPIPFRIYKLNQPRLRNLWHQRMEEIEHQRSLFENVPIIGLNIIDVNAGIVPAWMNLETFKKLTYDAAIELSNRNSNFLIDKILISKIESFSGTPVFNIQFFSDNIIFRHLILRMHKKKENAAKELSIIKRIADESSDLVSYIPLEEPFISKGALFYYHVNLQTHDQLLHIDDFALNYFKSHVNINDFDNYFNKMFLGFKTTAIVYEKISGRYLSRSMSESYDSMTSILPPIFIIDLRQVLFKVIDSTLFVSKDLSYPEAADLVIASPIDVNSQDWISNEFKVINIINYNKDCTEIDIVFNEDICRILIHSDDFSKHFDYSQNSIILVITPSKCIQTITDFFHKESDLTLRSFNPSIVIKNLKNSIPKQGLFFAFRHRDLHRRNCLSSRSNFKIIDVADSGDALICCDVARIEISLLSYLIHELQLCASDIELILTLTESNSIITDGDDKYLIAKLIQSLRACFYSQFKVNPTNFDTDISYYLEICQQLNFSISSPMKFNRSFQPVIEYWNKRIQTYINS